MGCRPSIAEKRLHLCASVHEEGDLKLATFDGREGEWTMFQVRQEGLKELYMEGCSRDPARGHSGWMDEAVLSTRGIESSCTTFVVKHAVIKQCLR